MAGLVPAIQPSLTVCDLLAAGAMDARNKSGHDDFWVEVRDLRYRNVPFELNRTAVEQVRA